MRLIHSDFKKGTVRLVVEDADDLWYLSTIILPGDLVRGKTTRKIKLGGEESDKSVKKTVTVTIRVEKIVLEAAESLRLTGRVTEAPEDIPLSSYHSLTLAPGDDCSVHKENWLSYQKEKLHDATESKHLYLFCLVDRDEAIFALTKKRGFTILPHLKGDVPKKRMKEQILKSFHQEVITALQEYDQRYHPQAIILASPVFYKDDLYKQLTDPQLRKKITLLNCSSVTEQALNEVLTLPEVKDVLRHSRIRQETLLVEELLTEINKNGLAVYGWEEITKAVHYGAVRVLLVSDTFLEKRREAGTFSDLDQLMSAVDRQQGDVHLISTDHQAGKQLHHLGGIAALTRFLIR